MIKKVLFTILLTMIFIPLFGYFNSATINAEGAYVVSYIEDNGTLSKVNSYSDYNSALNKMKENKDYVVTHSDSLSPYKIIAMNSGLVYSYPYRGNNNTMNVYQNITSNYGTSGATTYVWAHAEMTYRGTYVYFPSSSITGFGHGFISVTLNGFNGYVDLEYCDLVPTKYLKKDLPITLGGNSRGNYSSEKSFNIIPRQHYYYTKTNGNYRDLCMQIYENWAKSGNLEPAVSQKIAIGVAPSFMQDGQKYYSDDGINFYSDRSLENFVGSYYNYYQFVPLRSYTNIKASTINSYIKEGSNNSGVMLNTGNDFINNQNEYGVNAAIVAAMGIHESGWGKSNISNDKYNLFGWGAYDANTKAATTYSSVSDCIASQMGDNLSNYLDVNCSCFYSQSLGNKGGGFVTRYASDPYWSEQIASYYYGLDKKDNDNNGGLTDYNSVNMALVIENTDIKTKANSSSKTLYKTSNKYGYQKNLIVNVLEIENGYAKTRLSNPIVDNKVIYPYEDLTKGTKIAYNKEASVGYIKVDKLQFINNTVLEEKIDESKLSLNSYVNNIVLNDKGLYIEGVGVIRGLNADNASNIKHQLLFKSLKNSEKTITIDCETSEMYYSLNDDKTYKYVKFSKTIPLNTFEDDYYEVVIKVINGQYEKSAYLLCPEIEFNTLSYNLNKTNYRISCDPLKSFKIQLCVDKIDASIIDLAKINKASIRPSIISYDLINTTVIEEKSVLNFKAHGFIYYLNYDVKENVEYNLFLVNEEGDVIKANTELTEAPTDFSKVFKTSFNLDNICFNSSLDLSTLSGKYRMIVQIVNINDDITYTDYIYVTNPDKYVYEGCLLDNRKYEFVTDEITNLLYLNISNDSD